MKRTIYILTFFLAAFDLFSQTSYTGFIDKYPIELVTDIYSDGDARAIYAYSNFDEPIVINGRLHKTVLTLFEKDKKGNAKATLTFPDFNESNTQIKGTWTDLVTGKQLDIVLTKTFDIDYGDSIEWKGREILQPVSSGDKYFKLIVSKSKGDFYPIVTGVKILQKRTDKLIQQLELECQLWGLENISVGDYNFDGVSDFSVFESSYAGPNTSSIYFLYDKNKGKYFDSGFSGTSLEFDKKTKRIYERNSCCAGTIVTIAEYKVVNNKMVLVKEHCYKWDEKKQELVERKMKDCQ